MSPQGQSALGKPSPCPLSRLHAKPRSTSRTRECSAEELLWTDSPIAKPFPRVSSSTADHQLAARWAAWDRGKRGFAPYGLAAPTSFAAAPPLESTQTTAAPVKHSQSSRFDPEPRTHGWQQKLNSNLWSVLRLNRFRRGCFLTQRNWRGQGNIFL